MLLVEHRSDAAKSNADHCRQQSGKERIPREGPAEEEGAEVKQKEHKKYKTCYTLQQLKSQHGRAY
jgi:hypothetical protein